MIKLIFIALIAYLAWRMIAPKLSPTAMSEAEARRLLDLSPGATPDDITAAHRRLIAKVHPDAGGTPELAARINRARDTLLDR